MWLFGSGSSGSKSNLIVLWLWMKQIWIVGLSRGIEKWDFVGIKV